MLALFHLTWLRLTEQPAKLLYLVATLAAVVLAWIVLSAFTSRSLLANSKVINSELVIENSRAQYIPFPLRHIPRLQQIPGADKMHWFTTAAFFCGDGSGKTVTVYGWDGDVDNELRKTGASEADLSTWHQTENGVLVGSKISEQCGLTQGTTISPRNIYGSGELPLYVIAVLSHLKGGNTHVHAHYGYINRFMEGSLGDKRRDTVIRAFINVSDPSRLDQLTQAIEQEFQSSDPPLKASVYGDADSLLGRFGQVQSLVLFIIGALALAVLSAFIAMTAHLIGQRRASMAILQTLGFNGQIQLFALALEMTCVMMVGTSVGIAAGYGALALLKAWNPNPFIAPLLEALHLIDGAIIVLFPALLLLLIATLAWPAIQIAKLKPIDYQRF